MFTHNLNNYKLLQNVIVSELLIRIILVKLRFLKIYVTKLEIHYNILAFKAQLYIVFDNILINMGPYYIVYTVIYDF